MQRNSIIYVNRAGDACDLCVLCDEVVNGRNIVVTAAGYSEDVYRMRTGRVVSLDHRQAYAGLIFDDDRAMVAVEGVIGPDEVVALSRAGFMGAEAFI